MSILSKQDLRCATTKDCSESCRKREGIWNNEIMKCNITKYLNSICYRIQSVQDGFVMDTSSLVSKDDIGCFQSNHWSPYEYSRHPVTTIPIFVTY